jgi:hypothetical protein
MIFPSGQIPSGNIITSGNISPNPPRSRSVNDNSTMALAKSAMKRIPFHSWEMEFSIQYHVTLNSQLNDQNSIRYYINTKFMSAILTKFIQLATLPEILEGIFNLKQTVS